MYPKKTLSAASLLSECERKRCRSLEARGCAKSESEFSMGTATTCPLHSLNRVHELPSTKKRGYLAVTSLALTGNTMLAQARRSQIQRTAVSDWVTCHRHVTLQPSTMLVDDDYITKKRLSLDNLFLTGNFLSSQAVSSQVLSAFMCLTTVFGMGTGGAT